VVLAWIAEQEDSANRGRDLSRPSDRHDGWPAAALTALGFTWLECDGANTLRAHR
jgi:hypothetical protein